MALSESIQAGLAAIAEDRTSGATEVAKHAASVVLQFGDLKDEVHEEELKRNLRELAAALTRAQPTMAPMLNLADRILRCLQESETSGLRDRLRAVISTYASQLDTSTSRIALHARELLKTLSQILTHSHSSVVKKTLSSLHQSGWKGSVFCTESRPMNEGIDLARDLAAQGIPVTLLADAAAFSLLPQVSALVLGADSVSSKGVVNKIGSSGFALAAISRSIPVYVLCGSEKFIPESLMTIEGRNPAELLPEEVANLTVHNVYFDITPFEHITGIITEEGLLDPGQIRDEVSRVEQDFLLKPSDLQH